MKRRLEQLVRNYDLMTKQNIAKELISIYWKIQYSLKDPKDISKKNKANIKKRYNLGVCFQDNISKNK